MAGIRRKSTGFDVGIGAGRRPATARPEVSGLGGENVDLLVNGRIRSSGPTGGIWLGQDSRLGVAGCGRLLGLLWPPHQGVSGGS